VIPFKAAWSEQKRKNELADVFRFLESRSQTIMKEIRPLSEVGQIRARTASAFAMIVRLNSGNESTENPGQLRIPNKLGRTNQRKRDVSSYEQLN
jgi:hypothetical protein